MTTRFKGYEPLSTEEWAKLQKANIVARLKTALPVGYGGGSVSPTPPPFTWTPAQMTNLEDWWRADYGLTLTGNIVDSWEGHNGSVFLPISPTSTYMAQYISSDANFNNQPSIKFNPNNIGESGYEAILSNSSNQRTAYYVCRINGASLSSTIFGLWNGQFPGAKLLNLIEDGVLGPYLSIYQENLISPGDLGVGTLNQPTYYFGILEYNGNSSPKTAKAYESATSSMNLTPFYNSSGTEPATDLTNVEILSLAGGQYGAGSGVNTTFVEVIVVNGLLDLTDLSNLETYLNLRYGL